VVSAGYKVVGAFKDLGVPAIVVAIIQPAFSWRSANQQGAHDKGGG
jgi:hypothetical protein